jgi:hypothetical protein
VVAARLHVFASRRLTRALAWNTIQRDPRLIFIGIAATTGDCESRQL